MMDARRPASFGGYDARRVMLFALACWGLLLAIVAGRLLFAQKVNHSVYFIFDAAGRNWIAGEELYGSGKTLFRYSPTVAAFFAPWSMLPQRAAEVLWRVGSAAAWIASLIYFFRVCVPTLDARRRWIGVLGSLPLALLSVNNGQTNVLLGALLFTAYADALRERWNRCAVALAAAVLFKLWPIAAAGLLILCFPKALGPRFAAALAAGLAAPFLFQRWDYVATEYRDWAVYLAADLRTDIDMQFGYRDFWLLNRLAGNLLTLRQYQLLQLGSGAALGAVVAWLRWRGRDAADLVRLAAFGGTIWMLGFGPATESCTYSLIGPLLAWAWLDPARSTQSPVERLLLQLSTLLFGVALLCVPTTYSRSIETLGLQPIGAALLFLRVLVAGRPVQSETATRAVFPLRRAA